MAISHNMQVRCVILANGHPLGVCAGHSHIPDQIWQVAISNQIQINYALLLDFTVHSESLLADKNRVELLGADI